MENGHGIIKVIIIKNKSFLSFKFNLILIFLTEKYIITKKGINIPTCLKRNIKGLSMCDDKKSEFSIPVLCKP